MVLVASFIKHLHELLTFLYNLKQDTVKQLVWSNYGNLTAKT